MPIYENNGKVYNIPDDKVEAFEQAFPGASVSYVNDGSRYNIPISKRDAFLNSYPSATLYSTQEEQQSPEIQDVDKEAEKRQKEAEKRAQEINRSLRRMSPRERAQEFNQMARFRDAKYQRDITQEQWTNEVLPAEESMNEQRRAELKAEKEERDRMKAQEQNVEENPTVQEPTGQDRRTILRDFMERNVNGPKQPSDATSVSPKINYMEALANGVQEKEKTPLDVYQEELDRVTNNTISSIGYGVGLTGRMMSKAFFGDQAPDKDLAAAALSLLDMSAEERREFEEKDPKQFKKANDYLQRTFNAYDEYNVRQREKEGENYKSPGMLRSDIVRGVLKEEAEAKTSYWESLIKRNEEEMTLNTPSQEEIANRTPREKFAAKAADLTGLVGSALASVGLAYMGQPEAAAAVSSGTFATFAMSSAGSAAKQAKDAGASDEQAAVAGIASGAIMWIFGKLPVNRFTKGVTDAAKVNANREIAKLMASGKTKEEVAKELTSILTKLGIGSKAAIKSWVGNILTSGASFGAMGGLQGIVPLIYENPDEYPVLQNVINGAVESAVDGVIMGTIVGGISTGAEYKRRVNTWDKQGFIAWGEMQVDPSNPSIEVFDSRTGQWTRETVKDTNPKIVDVVGFEKAKDVASNRGTEPKVRRENYSTDAEFEAAYNAEQEELNRANRYNSYGDVPVRTGQEGAGTAPGYIYAIVDGKLVRLTGNQIQSVYQIPFSKDLVRQSRERARRGGEETSQARAAEPVDEQVNIDPEEIKKETSRAKGEAAETPEERSDIRQEQEYTEQKAERERQETGVVSEETQFELDNANAAMDGRKSSVQEEIQSRLGKPFWTRQAVTAAENPGGEPIESDVVRSVTFADGSEAYIVGDDGQGGYVILKPDGTTGFLSQNEIEAGLQDGSIVDSRTVDLGEYLDMKVREQDDMAEQERMAGELATNLTALVESVQKEGKVNVGTPEKPEMVSVKAIDPMPEGGVVVETENGDRVIGWQQVADTMGLPFQPKTTQEIVQDRLAADLPKPVPETISETVPEDGITTAPVVEVTETPPPPEQKPVIFDDEFANGLQIGPEYATVDEDGRTVVDTKKLWVDDPSKWAEYNDADPEKVIDTKEFLDEKVKAVDKEIESKRKDLKEEMLGSMDQKKMSGLKKEIVGLQERKQEISEVLDKYNQPEPVVEIPNEAPKAVETTAVPETTNATYGPVIEVQEHKRGPVEIRTKTEEKDGLTVTKAVGIRNGEEVGMPTAHFPMPEGLKIRDTDAESFMEYGDGTPKNAEVLGVHEMREGNDGVLAATVVVRDDAGVEKYDVRLERVQPEETPAPAEHAPTLSEPAQTTPLTPAQEGALEFMGVEPKKAVLDVAQKGLDELQGRIDQANTVSEKNGLMREKAGVIKDMLDQLGAKNHTSTTREDVLGQYRRDGASREALDKLERYLKITEAEGERLRGFRGNGKVYLVADDIESSIDALTTYLHEDKHLDNIATGAPYDALKTGVSHWEMVNAVARLAKTHAYDNESDVSLADEIIANAAEIAETDGIDAIPRKLREAGLINEEFINFVQNNIEDGRRRNVESQYPGRRDALQYRSPEVNGRQNGGNPAEGAGQMEAQSRFVGGSTSPVGGGEVQPAESEPAGVAGPESGSGSVELTPRQEAERIIAEEGVSSIEQAALVDDSGVQLSIRTEADVERQIRDFAKTREGKKLGWTDEKIEGIIGETADLIRAIHAEVSGDKYYDEWAQRTPTVKVDWRDGVEKPTVTWSRANIEYKYDMSADLLCINNEGLETVLASPTMVDIMMKMNDFTKDGFTSDDYLRLYETLRDMGFVVPCKGCFDAAMRLKMLPSVSRKFVDLVNQIIDERNADPGAFDEDIRAKAGNKKTIEGLPVSARDKETAIRIGVAGDKLTEHINWAQLMSAEGQTKALSDWGGIFRAWQRTGAGRPKDKLLPEPWSGDIVNSKTTIIGKYGEKTPSYRDINVNQGTGLRRNSHSEFRPLLAIDEIQFMREAYIRGLTVFKYMKELDDVRLFGNLGVKFNMSFFPAFVEGSPAAGLDANGNYIAAEESVGGREYEYIGEDGKTHYDGMKGWQEAQKYLNKDVSLSSVVFSVPHLIKTLTDVPTPSNPHGMWGSLIPFHASGATRGSLMKQGLGDARALGRPFEEAFTNYDKGVTNFEAVQNDRFGDGWEILEGDKAGENVDPGHKLEFVNGTHYYNEERGLHLFSSFYIYDNELKPGHYDKNGKIVAQKAKKDGHPFYVDYNDKVREIGTDTAYKDAADFYINKLRELGLEPRFDFDVPENIFLKMCSEINVDPNHPKLGWKGPGNTWSPVDSEAYYSLFCDYGMIDPATGKWAPHNPVGVIDENGNRVFRLPDNTIDIIKDGIKRYGERKSREEGRVLDAIEEFAKRSVAEGKLSQEDADAILADAKKEIPHNEESVSYSIEAGGPISDLGFSIVGDKDLIRELDASEKVTGIREVVLNSDGSMSPPMAGNLGRAGMRKTQDSRRETAKFFFNQWERSDENPDLADEDGKIKLIKTDNAKRGLVDVDRVDYNPYNHLRLSPVNKQFKDAWKRPDLIFIECEVPKSEVPDFRGIKDVKDKVGSPYHAEKAALPVGIHDWNGGPLMLSRYDKPVGQIDWDTVADAWAKDEDFINDGIPFDIVNPQLLQPLVDRGMKIIAPGKGKDKNEAYKAWKSGDMETYKAWRDTGKAPKRLTAVQRKRAQDVIDYLFNGEELSPNVESALNLSIKGREVSYPESVTKKQRSVIEKNLTNYTDEEKFRKGAEIRDGIDRGLNAEHESRKAETLRELESIEARKKELKAIKKEYYQNNRGNDLPAEIPSEINDLNNRAKELRSSLHAYDPMSFDAKKQKDWAILESGVYDNEVWREVGTIPTFDKSIADELKRMGWNGKSDMMYATEYGFMSHWVVHHSDMTPEEITADMLQNIYAPSIVGFIKGHEEGLAFIRKGANDTWYTTVIGTNRVKGDGSLMFFTSYKGKDPSKKLTRTLEVGYLKGAATANQISLDFGNHDAKVGNNSESANISAKNLQLLRENDAKYMQSVNSGDMEKAQEMVDDAAEAAGYTIRGYHGTTHDFTIFDRSKGNAEGNWGKGFYFTNNLDDAEANYAGEGPDLTNRIEALAENMEWMDGYEDLDYEERLEKAREMLAGDNPHVISAAVRMENPLILDSRYGQKETFFDYDSGYNYETDEYEGEESGLLVDFVNAWNDVLDEWEWEGNNVSPAGILEYADDGGLTASQLEEKAREILDNAGVENSNGELASGEFLRQVFERMGFDGIVDNNVNRKFGNQRKYGRGMDGVGYGTSHIIAFTPEQIKQTDPVTRDDAGKVIPLSERFNPENNDIRFSVKGNKDIFYSSAAAAVNRIKMEKATPEQWVKMLEKEGGLKAGEDKWLGLSDWLKSQDKKSLTKQEIADYIDEHRIQIEEVQYDSESDEQIFKETEQLHPGFSDSFYIEVNASTDKPYIDGIMDYQAAVDLYNRENDDKIEWTSYLSDADEKRLIDFGERILNSGTKSHRRANETRLHYTTDGLENKREIALTVPTIEPYNEGDNIHFGDAGNGRAVAWTRFGETTDADGNRVLVIDEIQSKRHQDAREKGYKDETALKELQDRRDALKEEKDNTVKGILHRQGYKHYDEEGAEFEGLKFDPDVLDKAESGKLGSAKEMERIKQIDGEISEIDNQIRRDSSIPAAPFEKNWHELAMKRMLRLAAEEGYDYVAWTKGEQQAERYNIGKVIDYLQSDAWRKPYDESYGEKVKDIRLGVKDGSIILITANENGEIVNDGAGGQYKGHKLSEIVGKDLANRLLESVEDERIEGDGLRVGGEGMRGFYDDILPRFMNKYGKKWGVKVEDITLPELEESARTMHAVPVTQEMKESVMQGQPMFSIKGKNPEAIDAVDKSGLPGVIGEENTKKMYWDAIRLLPDDARRQVVDKAMANGLDFEKSVNQYIGKLAEGGTENDETGLLRVLYDEIRTESGNPDLRDEDIRYMIWRNAQDRSGEDDLLSLASETAMKHRFGLDKSAPQFSVTKEFGDKADESREKLEKTVASEEAKLKDVERRKTALSNGITDKDKQDVFVWLTGVPDVGAMVAKSVVTSLTPEEIRAAIKSEDVDKLTSVPGVGKTTAEKLIAQLKDSVEPESSGARVRSIVDAMRGQREYDRATVNSLVKYAKDLLKAGSVDSMTRTELTKLLTMVGKTTGKSPVYVDKYADQMVDVILDNVVKKEKANLDKLIKVKDKKVDKSGVEVMGKLDKLGQITVAALRGYKDSDPARIEERLAEVSDQLSSSDDAVRENAWAEYSGLELAQRYHDDVKMSEEEAADLMRELKEAKSTVMSEKAYREFVKETTDAIRENKITRIESMQAIASALGEGMKKSIEAAREFRKAKEERINEIHHDANRDLMGTETREHREAGRVDEIINNSFVRMMLSPLATFDQMLRQFGRHSVNGEGYLWNRYMRGWVDATEKSFVGFEDQTKILDDKVSEMFGKKMIWSDLYDIERKIDKEHEMKAGRPHTVKFMDGGEMREHELTSGNLLYIYMVNKMTDGRMKLRKMGITQDHVDQIKKELDPRFIQLADWVQDEFLVSARNRYNAVHEQLFGAPMAAIENYFPLKINKLARVETVEPGGANFGDNALPSTTTGAIIKRRTNSLALDITKADAFSVVIEHLQQMEEWAAFAPLREDMKSLLSYKTFRNKVMNMKTVYGSGETLWNNFRNVVDLASGVYKPKIAKDSVDTIALNVAKGVTGAKIAFRVQTALKQLLSAPAFLSDADMSELVKSVSHPARSWNWCWDNLPVFRKRWKSRIAGDTRLEKTDSDWDTWSNAVVQALGRYGMTPNAFVDAMTVSVGAKAMYETKLKKYKELGLPDDVADRRAKQDATILYNQTQQSNEGAFVSAMQKDRTFLAATLSTYRNSSMGYTRQLFDAIRNYTRMGEKGETDLVTFATNQRKNEGADEEKARQFSEKEYNREKMRNAVRIGIFGFVLPLFWNLGVGPLLYTIFGKNKKRKEKILHDTMMHTLAGPIEGLAGGNVISEIWNTYASGGSFRNFSLGSLPAVSDTKTIFQTMENHEVKGINQIIDLVVQSKFGVNPQTATDAAYAIMDACNGDLGTAKEIALLMMRITQFPQSAIDDFYFDEIEMAGKEAKNATAKELAERYAKYKVNRNAPLTNWAYSDAEREKREKNQLKVINDKLGERKEEGENHPVLEEAFKDVKKEMSEYGRMLNRAKKDNDIETYKELQSRSDYKRYQIYKKYLTPINRYERGIKDTVDDGLKEKWTEARNEQIRKMIDELDAIE